MYFLQHNNQPLWHCLSSGTPTAGCTQKFWNALFFFWNACFFLQNAHFFLPTWQFAMSISGKVDWVFVEASGKVEWFFDCTVQQSTCVTMMSHCIAVCDL